jgi:hypothetical protein
LELVHEKKNPICESDHQLNICEMTESTVPQGVRRTKTGCHSQYLAPFKIWKCLDQIMIGGSVMNPRCDFVNCPPRGQKNNDQVP